MPTLRLWPGVVLAALLIAIRVVVPLVVPGAGGIVVLGSAVCGLLILLWWLFFSRAPWAERLVALALIVLAVVIARFVVHPSIAGGMMGMMLPILGTPLLCLALVVWAVASRGLSTSARHGALVGAMVAVCGLFAMLRTGGVSGDAGIDLNWRWTPTPEERLLAQAEPEPPPPPSVPPVATAPVPAATQVEPQASAPPPAAAETSGSAPAVESAAAAAPVVDEAEWPGFRGPNRDSVVPGVRIETDWAKAPPKELWRKPIGPGWSSFAVHGNRVFTQEQRGEDEIVSAYDLATGEPVWRHRDPIRFYESNAGAGPRGTPTVAGGRIYAMGATGLLNALDERTGARIWSRNAAADTRKTVPDWGIASSPLVVDDVVIVAVAGQLAAYDAATGKPRWMGAPGGGGYSSPHLVTFHGVPQVVLARGARTISVAPNDGSLLWEQSQPSAAVSILQPAVIGDELIVAAGDSMGGAGLRRLSVAHAAPAWTVQERWTSRGLKPYFNDFVVHEGHAYGFDSSILAAVDLADGTRKWKGGRFGHGQMLLLPDQNLLLVLSEDGELALVSATPDKFTEIARVPAIEGKTWNHPVLVNGVVLVRNGEEMAAFRLTPAGS